MKEKDIWIAALVRGHNGALCLLKNGEVVFSIEEERISRVKYDGTPFGGMAKILDYTDKLDYLVIAHTATLEQFSPKVDYTGEDIYFSMARKLGLISWQSPGEYQHPQIIDLGSIHHKLHAACAFYRSGFETATAVVIDGAGSGFEVKVDDESRRVWETETIFNVEYPNKVETLYKHACGNDEVPTYKTDKMSTAIWFEEDSDCEAVLGTHAGITKIYEAATHYCGWHFIEAGKTMGLAPYGKENPKVPNVIDEHTGYANKNLIYSTYPNGAYIDRGLNEFLSNRDTDDLTKLQNRRDVAYAVQKATQQQALTLILDAVKRTGNKNVVLCGGYGLNCVANYWYLEELNKQNINLYVEPISSDAGTAIGAALLVWHDLISNFEHEFEPVDYSKDKIYLGFEPSYDKLYNLVEQYNAEISNASDEDVIELITSKNIVSLFQGKSEAGPRALGNRSILYDPTDPNGKDHVNTVKRREYFRPFAGSILKEDVHDWFDLRGMEETPYMMYAVNCKPGVEEKIPSIIHVDGTCRIQTVTEEQNPLYYRLIKEFKKVTGCPIIFNTSFNLGGEPLVETLDDALRTLANSQIEYLYLPELGKLVTIKND